MTTAGWIFLALAWGGVIGLCAVCLTKVWRQPPSSRR
jgi:hypothetical protein